MFSSSLRRFAALLATLLLAVPALAGAATPSGPPVEIPAIIPQTGALAFLGSSQQQGLQILEKHINETGGIRNRPLHFTILDDQSNPQVSVQLFNQVASRGAQAVLGGAVSGTCKATLPLAQANGPVLYCLSPAVRPPAGSYVFTGSIHPVDLSAATFRYFAKRGWTNVALLLSTDASAQEVDAGVDGLLARMPQLHLVARERFAPADVSVAAQVSKIEAAHPQAILIWAGTGIPIALKGFADAGNKVPIATSNSIMLYSIMDQFASVLPDPLLFAAPKWAAYPSVGSGPVRGALDDYYHAFKAAGVKPDMGQSTSWDPALIVVAALRALGPDAKAAQIRDWIAKLHGFAGPNGFYDFRTGDQRGLNPNDTVMVRWDAAKKTWVAAP